MGTNHTKATYPTLVINENHIKTKITTTEQKVITLTKTLEKHSHKIKINSNSASYTKQKSTTT